MQGFVIFVSFEMVFGNSRILHHIICHARFTIYEVVLSFFHLIQVLFLSYVRSPGIFL